MNLIEERKRELLLESDLNRQVMQLESEQFSLRLRQIRRGVLGSRWKLLAPVAGLLFAWRFRAFKGFLKSGVGLLLLRKLWDSVVGRR